MSKTLDANQLESAWDALLRGDASTIEYIDAPDRELLADLMSLDAPLPSATLVRNLEASLGLAAASAKAEVRPTTSPTSRSIRPPRMPTGGFSNGQPSRWMRLGAALAAVALVVLLSGVAISRTYFGEHETAIPAATDWTDDGPSTSAGVTLSPVFSNAYSAADLADFAFDDWGWIELMQGSVAAGVRMQHFDRTPGVQTQINPGLSVIGVVQGRFMAQIADGATAWQHDENGAVHVTGPSEVTLNDGESLIYGKDALDDLWNPLDTATTFIAGGLFTKTDSPIIVHFDEQESNIDHTGIAIGSTALDGVDRVDLSLAKVTIPPGDTFAYTITPQTLMLVYVNQEGLEKQAWSHGIKVGQSQRILASSYSLHQDNPGYYTLTNTGTEPVAVSLFEVTPPAVAEPSSSPSVASVDTLFDKVLSIDDLATYESDQWKWIGFTQGTMAPGDQAVIVEGSPAAGDVGFEGLGAVVVTSGTLVANAAAGAVVQRGATNLLEPVDRSATVTLEAGDTLIVPPSTLPAIWNKSDADATYVSGGIYTANNITPLNEMDFDFTRGGVHVDREDLPIGSPIAMSFQQVEIPPGASYTYTVNSETWLEAIVSGGSLQQQKRIDGVPQDKAKTLVESIYSLHVDGFGDYTLTNDGSETVEVSFFRIEADTSASAPAS